jgi:hypothetical protein
MRVCATGLVSVSRIALLSESVDSLFYVLPPCSKDTPSVCETTKHFDAIVSATQSFDVKKVISVQGGEWQLGADFIVRVGKFGDGNSNIVIDVTYLPGSAVAHGGAMVVELMRLLKPEDCTELNAAATSPADKWQLLFEQHHMPEEQNLSHAALLYRHELLP